jgi:hypothetical protein
LGAREKSIGDGGGDISPSLSAEKFILRPSIKNPEKLTHLREKITTASFNLMNKYAPNKNRGTFCPGQKDPFHPFPAE